LKIEVETGMEINFQNINDFIEFCEYSKHVCIISMPKMDELFKYVKNIGSGSQASIDVYNSLLTEENEELSGPA
jgi:hypothetical protein